MQDILRRTVQIAVPLLMCTCLLSGCFTYHEIRVHVQDAETHAPIGGAYVEMANGSYLEPILPAHAYGVTDAQGNTGALRVAFYRDLFASVKAPGYTMQTPPMPVPGLPWLPIRDGLPTYTVKLLPLQQGDAVPKRGS